MAFLLKKLAVVLFLSSFLIVMPSQTKAGDCETTISSTTTSQLNCADDDNLNVTLLVQFHIMITKLLILKMKVGFKLQMMEQLKLLTVLVKIK
jgi:hypothetical protein